MKRDVLISIFYISRLQYKAITESNISHMSANKIAIRNVKWDAVNDMVLTQCPKHGQPNCITERIVAADHLTQRINTQLSIDPGRSILKTPGPNNKYLNLTFKKKKKKNA